MAKLPPPPVYTEGPLPGEVLDALIADAQARHRSRIGTLDALHREHSQLGEEMNEGLAETSSVWDLVSAALGPGEVGPHLRRLLGRIPVFAQAEPAAASATTLERKLEQTQRQLLRLDHHLVRISADRAALQGELDALTTRLGHAAHDAELAADDLAACRTQLVRDADDADLLARVSLREAELRALTVQRVRLRAVLGLQHEFLRLVESVAAHLGELREASAGVLDALDRKLGEMAAEAQARDLARAVGEDIDDVRASVARVNRCATEGAVLLTETLDRLADEVDLLSPNTPTALNAQREVRAALRQDAVDDLVRYTRDEAARKRRLAQLTGDEDV
ncbi:MAG: hypothetical protein H6739_14985 [Alphaproteobacteria bacterium]|nr:hypothetical protein [Alphaproteobacteria bacterium]